jgi:hypothetical protein
MKIRKNVKMKDTNSYKRMLIIHCWIMDSAFPKSYGLLLRYTCAFIPALIHEVILVANETNCSRRKYKK